jgi:flagellar assembly protein FliH
MAKHTQVPVPRAVKYTFDTVFGEAVPAAQGASRTRSSYSADEVERIKSETFAAGKTDAEARAATLKAGAMSNVGDGVARLLATVGEMHAAMRAESVELALAVAKKLAESALKAFPLHEIEELVVDCLHKLHREPRLVVRVPSDISDDLQAEIHGLADRHGFAGRIVVLPEQSLRGADCRVEWAGGGLERDFSANLAAIDEAVARWRTLLEAESKS